MAQLRPLLAVSATISDWETKLDELEKKNPERYAEFMEHLRSGIKILAEEQIISEDFARVFDD